MAVSWDLLCRVCDDRGWLRNLTDLTFTPCPACHPPFLPVAAKEAK